MITIVYWDELDSDYNEADGEMAEVESDSDILTATESMEEAFDAIKEHQKRTEGRDIQYVLTFWLAGKVLCHAAIAENTAVDNYREEITSYVKSFLH